MKNSEVTEVDFDLHTFEILSKLGAEYYVNLSDEEATMLYTLPEDERQMYVDSICYDRLRKWAYRKNQETLFQWSELQKERNRQKIQEMVNGIQ